MVRPLCILLLMALPALAACSHSEPVRVETVEVMVPVVVTPKVEVPARPALPIAEVDSTHHDGEVMRAYVQSILVLQARIEHLETLLIPYQKRTPE